MGRKGNEAALLHTRREIRSDIAGLPMLFMDATAPVDVIRRFVPRINLLADLHAVAPNLQVNQVLGGWGKTSLVPSPNAATSENQRRDGLLEQLADFVRLHGHGHAAVITYEKVEERFRGLPGVVTGHFGNVSSLNAMQAVDALFIIGRPLADPRDQLLQARALTGKAIQPETPHKTTRGVLLADGSGVSINVRAYADPDLEALRIAVTEAEVIQAIGRGRGVNRDADRPLTVWLMADVLTPLPVENLVRWEDVRLSALGRMMARGAALLSPRDAWAAYPWLFASPDAARMAIGREPDFPNIPLLDNTHRGMFAKWPLAT